MNIEKKLAKFKSDFDFFDTLQNIAKLQIPQKYLSDLQETVLDVYTERGSEDYLVGLIDRFYCTYGNLEKAGVFEEVIKPVSMMLNGRPIDMGTFKFDIEPTRLMVGSRNIVDIFDDMDKYGINPKGRQEAYFKQFFSGDLFTS